MKNKLNQISGSAYFLIVIILIYVFLFIFRSDLFLSSLKFSYSVLLKVIPIFFLIFVLMALTNYFVKPNFIIKHLKNKGIKKWFFVIIGGILSSGPIYMWYPLLADLKQKGLNYGLIACFLYNRAIKIPLLPLMVLYFSWHYVIVLFLVMITISIFQGLLINKLMGDKS